MLRRIGAAIQVLVGLVLVLGLAAGLAWIIYTSITKAPAVVAAVVTGFAALLALAYQRFMEQQREDERERRKRMAPIYEQLVRTFYQGAGGGELAEAELAAFFEELAQSLLVWGSEPVIAAFNDWRATIAVAEGAAPEAMFAFERLLAAIRTDLGNQPKDLVQGDLLRVFINDIDAFLPVSPAPLK
jgi:hypothetical protein